MKFETLYEMLLQMNDNNTPRKEYKLYHCETGRLSTRYLTTGDIAYVDEDGFLDRSDGPALTLISDNVEEKFNRYEGWFKHGKLHRLDGPAVITRHIRTHGPLKNDTYYINGKKYTKEEYERILSGVDKDQIDTLTDMLGGFE